MYFHIIKYGIKYCFRNIGINSAIYLPFKFSNIFILLFALLWLIEPYIMCKISKEYKIAPKIEELNQGEKEYLLNLGKEHGNILKIL